MRFATLSMIPLAGLAVALQVTQPQKGEEFKTSDSITVKWSSVNTDVSSFNIYLVDNTVYPPVNKEIAKNVKTSDNTYTIKDLSGLTAGHGYQVNLESDSTQNTGILAQSQQFNVTSSAQSSSSSSSSSASSASSTSASASTDSSSTATSTQYSMTTGTTTGTFTTTSGTQTLTGTTTGTFTSSVATGTTTNTKAAGSGSSTSGANASGTSGTAVPTGNAAAAVRPVAALGLVAGALAFAL
ncbi:UPF0619 GPI-anchored membrane protein [Penicillium diatomitis]|uniref:UPF0619 GPI-anchored membrane protein n=1 Tax=Penicillium diatomitis TaxID=2819901 RepID=A0A9W9XI26_9EURO|nr:UPF0619 GPI-anchored membrane protein [Penicillium diatomitis]KAJ5493289.1 UPF0619 GPI-anchored membrane protein [Penicillium diatomitis]